MSFQCRWRLRKGRHSFRCRRVFSIETKNRDRFLFSLEKEESSPLWSGRRRRLRRASSSANSAAFRIPRRRAAAPINDIGADRDVSAGAAKQSNNSVALLLRHRKHTKNARTHKLTEETFLVDYVGRSLFINNEGKRGTEGPVKTCAFFFGFFFNVRFAKGIIEFTFVCFGFARRPSSRRRRDARRRW